MYVDAVANAAIFSDNLIRSFHYSAIKRQSWECLILWDSYKDSLPPHSLLLRNKDTSLKLNPTFCSWRYRLAKISGLQKSTTLKFMHVSKF